MKEEEEEQKEEEAEQEQGLQLLWPGPMIEHLQPHRERTLEFLQSLQQD